MKQLNIVVCVKQTVDKDINPFDACALEAALSIENAKVTVVCMGPPSAEELLRRLSRLGVERCILLTDSLLAGSDTLATSYALSLLIKKCIPYPDLVFCGRQSIDGDTAQVGPELAVALDFSLITNVLEISLDEIRENVICRTRFGDETAKVPALVTIERINTLRFPRLGSKCGEVVKMTAADIDAKPERCGHAGSPTKVLRTFESVLGRRKCNFIDSYELLSVLERESQKEVTLHEASASSAKLPLVWCVGEKPCEKAKSIANASGIRIIDDKLSPSEIVSMARAEKPSVILWSSDFSGRRNAPQAAYMLSTGLCADCTSLETDGERLFMYRPAFSGSIMAKIECKTLPQMATVRSADDKSERVIIGIGLGAMGEGIIESLRSFASENGYGFGASRAIVDKLSLPYEEQIGLTGRSICPQVYVAIGISGAVQHTCAIEQAKTVIAVNPDRKARIFDYADYGIVCRADEIAKIIQKGL